MATFGDLEFVNRGAELQFLQRRLRTSGARPALIVIRSPAGFGKSSLTERLEQVSTDLGRPFCVVDPSIRGRTGSASPYDGFFLQRVAEQLDRLAREKNANWPRFSNFLATRRFKSAAEKNPFDLVAETPSIDSAYKLAVDYVARAFSLGKFAPRNLLASDDAHAVRLCSAYAQAVLTKNPVIVVVREAHHIDLHSLRSLLLLCDSRPGPDLILEYTSEDDRFEPEHQKLLLRAADRRQGLDILDLLRLEKDHLEYLIRRNVRDDFALTSDYYLSWSGDLRSVIELKFRVGVGRVLTEGAQIGQTLSNLSEALDDHIRQLTPLEKIVTATVLAHVEAIDRNTLSSVLSEIDPRVSQPAVAKAIDSLASVHAFLSFTMGAVRIHNETVALALQGAPDMKGRVALAERALRDHYGRQLFARSYGGTGLSDAVRQYFRLSARTKDAVGLLRAVEHLAGDVKRAQDQSVYVDVIASAIEADPLLYGQDHSELVLWAASLAYDICDWPRAERLLLAAKQQGPFTLIMRACALQEIGRHDDALELAATVANSPATADHRLAAELVRLLVIGCRGEHAEARRALTALVGNPVHSESALLGYAYRFFEIVDGFIESLPKLEASIAWFAKHGFAKSKAYSQLPAAVFLARSGNVAGARSMVAEAQATLANDVRAQHVALNNRAAVELLDDAPAFVEIRAALQIALQLARDDFTEITILTNLGIAHCGGGELEAAVDCAEKCMAILEAHDFADTDIYWPVCFNASVVFDAAGLKERKGAALRFPGERGRPRSDNQSYWAYRFGEADLVEDRYRFLASRRWHPVYLSHWLIDLEGLNLLKTKPPTEPGDTTSPAR